MESFSVSYTSKSLYQDLSDVVYFSHSFSHRKNKQSRFLYHFGMFGLRYLGGLAIFTIIELLRLPGRLETSSDYIMYTVVFIPSVFALLIPKQCFILAAYLIMGSNLKNIAVRFLDSYFEIGYHYGLVHKYAYTDLKKVVETEKIIKFYPGIYIMKKYLTEQELDSLHNLLSEKMKDKYISV